MVESIAPDELLRNLTPKPSLQQSSSQIDAESFSGSGGDSSELAKPYDLGVSAAYMQGDDSSRGVADQAGGSIRRPPSHNQPNQPRRPQNSTNSPQFSLENSLGSSPHYSQYGQRAGFFGQYTMSPKPPMAMAPSNPNYAYPHAFQSVPENSMIPQNIHASYQTMIPPAPVYRYQRHASEGPSPGFSNQPLFSHPSQGGSPSPPMSSPSTSQNTTPPYHGQFHSLRYPSSMSPSQYPYSHHSYSPSHHSYSPSPVYQSQYAPAPYPQHFTSPAEVEGQGTWWYLPHAAPNAPSYPGHYPMTYSPVHQELENAYPASPVAGTSLAPDYSILPARSPAPFHPARRPSSSLAAPEEESPASSSPGPVASSSKTTGEKSTPAVRRPYHPNPPSHRSEWVMWAGNVPSDATHDELWRFFNQSDDPGGVLSVFLISRSSCAFVNYESEAQLQAAIAQFNGIPLRSHDPRCPRLVCRVRKIDDDLKAGVGGQRGVGMHTKWLRDLREKTRGKKKATDQSDQSDFDDSNSSIAALSASVSSDDDNRPLFAKGTKSNSSGSYASTNSSLLTRHFPKRYFILKSLSQYDLDLSVQKGLWATQKHNEGILDQAYRTSNEVYLIFGVNKSGEFYGYAKMAGPVRKGEQRVSWATRTDSSASSHSSLSPVTSRAPIPGTIPEEPSGPLAERLLASSPSAKNFFPEREHRMVEASPVPVTPAQDQESPALLLSKDVSVASAPAELGTQHHRITMSTPSTKLSLGNRLKHPIQFPPSSATEDFELDESAPYRAMRSESSGRSLDEDLSRLRLNSVGEEVEESPDDPDKGLDEKPETWGEPFKVEWICTDRLPFFRTRHLRNPWNHDREVKVSRDGTEIEPSVGEQLLQDWNKVVEEGAQQVTDPVSAASIAKPTPKRLGSTWKSTPNASTKGAKDRETGLSISRS
ncbi:YT521-B-like domain-containing protein [Lentinula guzmanii]|uniref:YT521-B-like domain-containing protein n=1 Tax=Lentinula guzmanii TaxID=2804957 RepID=A0AA38N4C7_9AGAR|nr:YT521-B-like domain-containing protein [Lentinula guzmanii]